VLGKPAIGEILHAGQELDNAVDKLAVNVVQNNKTVGHLPWEYLQILDFWLQFCEKKCGLYMDVYVRYSKEMNEFKEIKSIES